MSNILHSPNPNALESPLYNPRCGPAHAGSLRDGLVVHRGEYSLGYYRSGRDPTRVFERGENIALRLAGTSSLAGSGAWTHSPNELIVGRLFDRSAQAGFPRPSWLGSCARLAQPLQRVTRAPFFLHLAPSYAMNEDGLYFDILARAWHAQSLSLIVGAVPR
jgi:hypothetical protein